MNISGSEQAAIEVALRGVRVAAEACTQQPDLEATKRALIAVRDAAVIAAHTINEAKSATRSRALRQLEIAL